MAKVQGPLLSIGAQGQIAQSQVYGSWRGVSYVRRYVVPSNPNTSAQQSTRGVFSGLSDLYKFLPTDSRQPWELYAKGRALTARNALIRSNLPPLRAQSDMLGWVGSPGAGGAIPLESLDSATSGASGQIDVTVTTPGAPAGWTLDAVVAQAVPDRDPTTAPTVFVGDAVNNSVSPGGSETVTISGLVSAQDYVVAAWCRWSKASGETAVSISTTHPSVVTVT